MSLADARPLDGRPLPPLPPGPTFECRALADWRGRRFLLAPGDDRLPALARGGEAPSPPFHNTVGDLRLWTERPDWMNYLEPSSPAHDRKLLERDLYLHHWKEGLDGARRILDVGGGIGRFTWWLLARDREVEMLDPDPWSLCAALDAVAGGPGRLDLHWTTGENLPDLPPFDAVIASEVLCYVEDPGRVVDNIVRALRPGGALVASLEAPYGWAAALDVAPGTLGFLLDGGVVEVPGDRWVRTFTEEAFRDLLAPFRKVTIVPTHYVTAGPFEGACGAETLEELLYWEDRCRRHPLTRPWHRAWTAVAWK